MFYLMAWELLVILCRYAFKPCRNYTPICRIAILINNYKPRYPVDD